MNWEKLRIVIHLCVSWLVYLTSILMMLLLIWIVLIPNFIWSERTSSRSITQKKTSYFFFKMAISLAQFMNWSSCIFRSRWRWGGYTSRVCALWQGASTGIDWSRTWRFLIGNWARMTRRWSCRSRSGEHAMESSLCHQMVRTSLWRSCGMEICEKFQRIDILIELLNSTSTGNTCVREHLPSVSRTFYHVYGTVIVSFCLKGMRVMWLQLGCAWAWQLKNSIVSLHINMRYSILRSGMTALKNWKGISMSSQKRICKN